VSGQAILSAGNSGKLLGGGRAPPRPNPAGELTALPGPPSWWGGGRYPSPGTPPSLSTFDPSVVPPTKNPERAPAPHCGTVLKRFFVKHLFATSYLVDRPPWRKFAVSECFRAVQFTNFIINNKQVNTAARGFGYVGLRLRVSLKIAGGKVSSILDSSKQ